LFRHEIQGLLAGFRRRARNAESAPTDHFVCLVPRLAQHCRYGQEQPRKESIKAIAGNNKYNKRSEGHQKVAQQEGLHHALQDRLRARRAAVAAALAEAQDTPEQALEGLMAILQLHEHDARGHATRVARLAVAVGDEMGFTDEELGTLERGGLLHDIGKLDMPASILSKPGPLDEDEWRIMRTHPQVGYDLLRNQPRFADAAEVVLSHHEAYDGTGYPRRLESTRIPKAARVLAVADAYDSMTHPHTQRPAMPPSLAIEEIARCSGKQFDPQCAEALGCVLAHALESEAHAAV